MTKYLTIAAIAVLLCSCANDDTPSVSGEPTPMVFAPADGTRATAFDEKYDDFAVFAWMSKEGAQSLVLGIDEQTPYKVEKVDDEWVYDKVIDGQELKYWDYDSSSYEFIAVAPYSSALTVTEGTFKIQAVTANLFRDSATEWAHAANRRINNFDGSAASDYDRIVDPNCGNETSNGDLSRDVIMPFHYILSLIEFTIQNSAGNTSNINSATVRMVKQDGETYSRNNIITKADYNITNGIWETPYTPTSYTLLNYSTETTAADTPVSLGGLITEIPQSIDGLFMEVTINTDKNTYVKYFPLTDEWKGGYIYTYRIKIDDEMSIIYLDVDVERFGWQEGNYGTDDEGNQLEGIDGGTQDNW